MLFRFDGTSWQPADPTSYGVVHGLWAGGAEVFLAGDNVGNVGTANLLHYDGTQWVFGSQDYPQVGASAPVLRGIWGSSPSRQSPPRNSARGATG